MSNVTSMMASFQRAVNFGNSKLFQTTGTQEIPKVFDTILEENKRIIVIARGDYLKQVKHIFNKLRDGHEDTITYIPQRDTIYNVTTKSEIRFLTTGPTAREHLAKWNGIDEGFLYGLDPDAMVWRDICRIITKRRNEDDQIEHVTQTLLSDILSKT